MFYQAPLRLSIAGGGTDVEPFSSEIGSAVINFAIKKEISVEVQKFANEPPGIELQFTNKAKLESDYGFSLQLKGALQHLFGDYISQKLRLVISNPVGSGSGLGASSTIVALVLYVLGQELELNLTPSQLTSLAFDIERNRMQRAGGFQDYFPAIYGGLNRLEKYSSSKEIRVFSLPITSNFRDLVNNSIFCFNLGQQRSGEEVIKDQVKRSQNRLSVTHQALSAQLELVKTIDRSIREEDYELMLDAIDETYSQKKKFSPMITNELVNEMERRVRKLGGRGIKVSGAGGGGYMFSFFKQGVPKGIEEILEPRMSRLNIVLQDVGARKVQDEQILE